MTRALRTMGPLKQASVPATRIPAMTRTFSPCIRIRQFSSIHTTADHILKRSPASTQHSSLSYRTYASSSDADGTCKLSFDLVEPDVKDQQLQGQTLVICHGLFGSKQNWRSLSKTFAKRLGIPVYTLDLRNHGHSPHVRPHDYSHMAKDLGRFMSEHGLEQGVNLVGHSMGGKAVMAFALNDAYNGCLHTLISADMAPSVGKISPEFAAYAKGMREIEEANVRTKSEGDKLLQPYEKSLPTRQFLLTNAITAPDKTLKFRIPLDIIHDAIPAIGAFPYAPGEASWPGPTLFVKGAKSNYINRRNVPVCREFFPNMVLETLDAGHWVHAERPMEFVDLVDKFVRQAK